MKTNIIANISNMKSIYTYLAIVLMVLGLSLAQTARAAGYIYEAVGIYGTSYTTNNTWTSTGTVNTGSACATTALSSNLEVTLSGGYIGTNAMTVYGKTNLKVKVTTGKIYRIVFSPANGNSSPNDAAHHFTCNGTGSISNNTWTSTGDGNSSVTFTGLDADDNFKITHINVYIKSSASDAQASLTPSSVTMSAGDADTYNFKLTTNLGITFDGANSPYQNQVETDASSSDIELCAKYDTYGYCQSYFTNTEYKNNSNIPVSIFAYNAGTYNADIFLGYQTGSNNDHSYYMKGIEVPFTVIVEDDCTETKVDWNAVSPSLTLSAIPCTTTSFTRTATAKLNAAPNTPTEQAIAYSSSNEEVAEVSSAGVVTINGVGNATIKATANSDGTYCKSENTYDITVTGFTVTLHYPSCAAAVGSTLTGTSKSFSNVCGAFSLDYNMAVEGYGFCGWTTNGSFADGDAAPTPLYTGSSVDITNNTNLYAVYQKHSNTFNKVPKNTTLTEGDYVLSISYDQGSNAQVMTNTLDGNKRMTVDNDSYTFTADGLTCTNDNYIWHLTPTGNSNEFTVYNAASKKYLGANNDATSSSDRQMRLEDAVAGNYQKWVIAQSGANTVPYQVKNVGRNANLGTSSGSGSTHYVGYFSAGSTIYFFKRTATSNAYTINPDCNAAEYTVTMQSAVGGTTVASATGATWSDPVLSGLHGTGSETVTITATPATGYSFTGWTVVSGGASLSGASDNPATFTMPAANVVIRPTFTAQTYQITYKDKNNAAFSGTPAEPSPDEYTYGVGATLPEVTKSGYVFMGWFVETDCSGTRVNSISTTDYGDKTFYAKFMQLSDYRAWCPEPTVTLTGDNVYITSTNGKSIMGVNTLTLNAINLVPGSTVRLSTPASSGIMFSKGGVKYNATTTTVDFTADAGGDITDETVYVHYYPTAAGTGAPTDITVTATYQTNTDYYSTRDVHVRNMPSAFAIAVKQGNNWFALPANIASATNPAGVPLNVDESSWTAKGPSTLAYELWPVLSTTGSGDRYADYGEKVRFSGNSNKGLWASTSSNTLNDNAAIAGIGTGSATDNYEWNLTTAVDGSTWKYTLQMQGNSNLLHYYNSSVWGSYASGISDIYLIPLTTVETAGMAVMEWGESEVAVKCAANTTLTKVTIDGTEVSPKPSLTPLGGDIYKITGGGMPNLSTLATYAMKPMVIEVEESSTAKQFVLTIPFILTSTNSPAATPKTAVDLRNYAAGGSQDARNKVIGVVDVVVRNGAQLDVTNAESTACSFSDLYIYPGGKVHINTKDLGAKNVYLRGGFSWLEAEKDYRLPQMLVESGKTISGIGSSGHGIYYDLYLDNSRYYMMCVPKDVTLASITNEEGGDDGKVWIKEYNGENRTKTPKEKGWVNITTASLLRGVGYEMAIKPRVTGRTIGIMRMPLLSATAWSDETACTPSVTAWGYNNDNVTANNKGWNFIGSPFFSSFRNTDANGQFGTNMEIRDMVQHLENGQWNGKWDFVTTSAVKYITIPEKMYDDYTDVRAKNYEIEAFYPFFIQAATTGTLSFTNGSKILKAPSLLRTAVPTREVDIDFILSDANGTSDQAGLTIGNDYSADFDMDDKEKTIVNENYLKVYTIVGEYRTAYNSLPEAVAELPIPVGYIAPIAGQYTFSLVEGDYSSVEHVWLTDYETSSTVDLLDGSYEFTTEKGMNNTRFALNVILKPETENTGTGVDAINADDGQPIKFIYEDKMFIKQNGVIYDATGKRVKEINK